MIGLVIVLLVLWAALAIIGLTVKALFWLFIVGAVLFVLTILGGAVGHSRKG
jgi:hypothetical protein